VSAAETVYTARIAYPDMLERARTQTVSLEIYRSGALVAPTEAGSTFSLYKPDGTAIVSGAAVTVSGSIATYSLGAASIPSTLALGRGYREEWALVLSGASRTYRRDAALVLHAAFPVITDADLTGLYSDLDRHLASGTTTFQTKIDEAWKRIIGRLEQLGVLLEHVVTSWSLREMHLELTYYLICLDFHRAQGGRWGELANGHKKEFELALGRMKFVKGTGADGQADSDTRHAPNRGVTYANASPRATWRGFGGIR
jgi:hypothetical protein